MLRRLPTSGGLTSESRGLTSEPVRLKRTRQRVLTPLLLLYLGTRYGATIPANTMPQASRAGTLPPVRRIDAEPLRFYLLEMDAGIMEGNVELQFLR